MKENYFQRINTNGILYSEKTEQALIQGDAEIRISVDSGSKECFRFMKGHDAYDEVWDHIRKYCALGDDVYIKYNVCNYNSAPQEIERFVRKCQECGVRHIIIDAEVNSYMPNKNAGPFYFTEKEFKAIHYLEKVAKEAGFDVQISGYAFSVREEKDEKGNRILPKKYFDNLDHEICSHDIKVQTFPNIRTMQGYIQKNGYEVVIWGGGYIGRKCIRILKEHGIEINYFQYKNQGVLWIPNNHYEFEMESY